MLLNSRGRLRWIAGDRIVKPTSPDRGTSRTRDRTRRVNLIPQAQIDREFHVRSICASAETTSAVGLKSV